MIFEGGWLDPYMKSTYRARSTPGRDAEGNPAGDARLHVSYSIGADSKNKDAAGCS